MLVGANSRAVFSSTVPTEIFRNASSGTAGYEQMHDEVEHPSAWTCSSIRRLESLRTVCAAGGYCVPYYGRRRLTLPGSILHREFYHLHLTRLQREGLDLALAQLSLHWTLVVFCWFTRTSFFALKTLYISLWSRALHCLTWDDSTLPNPERDFLKGIYAPVASQIRRCDRRREILPGKSR